MSEKNGSLGGNILRVLTANFWVSAVGFISSFIFPKILSIDDYALYHTYTLYLTYITILHLGFPSGMVINYAGKDYEKIEKKQYKTEMVILGSVLSFFAVVALVLSIILRNQMLAFVALAILPNDLIGSYKSLLQAWSKFKEFSVISTILSTAIPVIALLYYVVAGILPGNVYIIINLAVNWVIALFIINEIGKKIKGVKMNPVFTAENWATEKTGIMLVLGNYVHTLFTSSDKQFIKWFFGNSEFAFYSFGISMKALMTVFITSIAQPLFPAMAQGKFKDEDYSDLKELLIIFGSLSGCAYFATSIIVNNFIQKYINSLDVVGIYFVVFPAMAVVSCLYINLYKIKNMMRLYLKTIIGILGVSIVTNAIAVKFYPDYTGVAIATVVTYYVWFFLGFKQFKFLKLTWKDMMYLALYTVGFFFITRNLSDFIGMAVYFCFIAVIALVFYRARVKQAIRVVTRRKIN